MQALAHIGATLLGVVFLAAIAGSSGSPLSDMAIGYVTGWIMIVLVVGFYYRLTAPQPAAPQPAAPQPAAPQPAAPQPAAPQPAAPQPAHTAYLGSVHFRPGCYWAQESILRGNK